MLADPAVAAAQATVTGLEAAMVDIDFGAATVSPREWPAVAADLRDLNDRLRPTTDYAAQGAALPGLIADLQALTTVGSAPRREVLVGLMQCYHAAEVVTRNLGIRGLPALAAWHARRVAQELDDPAWLGLAEWLRSAAVGGSDRARAQKIASDAADALYRGGLGGDPTRHMYGSLHLQAALSAAAGLDIAGAVAHLDEALDVARPEDQGVGLGLYFGPANLGIWRVSMAAELGDTDHARHLARQVDPDEVASAARQAAYWSDLGRSLAVVKPGRDDAVVALRQAEDTAAVWTRTRPLVRETVTYLLPRVRRDTPAGRDLRGMAYRMGLAG